MKGEAGMVKSHIIRQAKKDIARIKTIVTEKLADQAKGNREG